MPEYVLERTYEIMSKNNITDISKVGFYGLTYKEDVDDVRESPTLQLIESMKKHLGGNIKVYDPFVKREIVTGQMFDFDEFVDSLELIVIMVGHSEIKNKVESLKGKIVFDTRNVISDLPVYHL